MKQEEGGALISFYRRFLMIGILSACLFITFSSISQHHAYPATADHPYLPSGTVWIPQDRTVQSKDSFAMLEFCRQTLAGKLKRPYSIAGQEQMFHNWCPLLHDGMPLPYAPPIFIWYSIFTFLPPEIACLAYCFLEIFLLALVFQFYLFPRAPTLVQLRYLLLTFASLSFLGCFKSGQNAIFTLTYLTLGWAAIYNHSTKKLFVRDLKKNLIAAVALLILSAKPNFALFLATVYLAAEAWIPLIIASSGFAAICVALQSHLGGWPTWFLDYSHLVNSYYPGGMGNFIHISADQSSSLMSFLIQTTPLSAATSSEICRILWPAVTVFLLFLKWSKKISISEFFVLNFANLNLFCPSFSGSDNWLIGLLITESVFFQNNRFVWLKALLLVGVVDLLQWDPLPWASYPIPFPCKLILLGWLTVEMFRERSSSFSRNWPQAASIS